MTKKYTQKKDRGKNTIIVALCATIIILAIGFIALSIQLDRVQSKEEIFDVVFIGTKKISSIKGGEEDPIGDIQIGTNGKVLSFDFQLFQDHDEMDYEITVENKGTVDASIVKLLMSPDYEDPLVAEEIQPISISLSDISGKILEPGEEATIKLTIIRNTSNDDLVSEVTGKIGLLSESYQSE